MGSVEQNLSWTALILSVAAFLISVSQMLQQYFATAEGYRRCQQSVLGPWFKHTRRKFRWSEFRFETLFQTPYIHLGAFVSDQSTQVMRHDQILVHSRSEFIPDLATVRAEKNNQWVCWLPFLEELNSFYAGMLHAFPGLEENLSALQEVSKAHQEAADEAFGSNRTCLTFPSFSAARQSWDFIPPDVLKPLARIDTCDLAILVRRLGMDWHQFQPHDGLMRAEGFGLILTSSFVRSLGCCVTISRLSALQDNKRFSGPIMIPDIQADTMGFGLLPVSARSGFPYTFLVGLNAGIIESIQLLNATLEAVQRVEELLSREKYLYSFLDLIPLVTPFIRRRKSRIVRIPAPLDRPSWIFISTTARTVFPFLLEHKINDLTKREIKATPKLENLLTKYVELGASFSAWMSTTEDEHKAAFRNAQPLDFLERVHDLWDEIDEYFEEKNNHERHNNLYTDLVKVHVRNAVLADKFAERIIQRDENRRVYPPEITQLPKFNHRMAETLAQYFYRLDTMRAEMIDLGRGPQVEAEFLELWAHLMVRGFCWHHCHYLVGGSRVPSEHWKSRIPIYIG